eukprot:CAMPEP_0184453916 /NCGR_PEP_ID=MMETSP0740-20130409/18379_1 /TAXON_ID=385413 /ORGANISM="Thalassiosira miniscula, Strain CCMP1093" /LENGTH=76 /DNA_ID=CAMNT_0026825283 /DNA_START=40 /DNA_END=270 /DNA_ORIENTATION=-
MKLIVVPAMLGSLAVLSGCSTGSVTQRDVECAGATVVGAVVGGALGNQLGGGSGQDILTAGGAVAGGTVANKAAGC